MRTVLLDCDGVLADLTGATMPFLKHFGVRFPVVSYDFGLDAMGKEYMRGLWSTPGFQQLIELTPEARDIVAAARAVGRVYIVTASYEHSKSWESERRAWLKKRFGIPASQVSFVPREMKHLVAGDIFVDDHYPNALAWARANPQGEAVLMEQTWSEIGDEHPQNLWIVKPDEVAETIGHLAGFKALSSPIARPVVTAMPAAAPMSSQNTGLSNTVG